MPYLVKLSATLAVVAPPVRLGSLSSALIHIGCSKPLFLRSFLKGSLLLVQRQPSNGIEEAYGIEEACER